MLHSNSWSQNPTNECFIQFHDLNIQLMILLSIASVRSKIYQRPIYLDPWSHCKVLLYIYCHNFARNFHDIKKKIWAHLWKLRLTIIKNNLTMDWLEPFFLREWLADFCKTQSLIMSYQISMVEISRFKEIRWDFSSFCMSMPDRSWVLDRIKM